MEICEFSLMRKCLLRLENHHHRDPQRHHCQRYDCRLLRDLQCGRSNCHPLAGTQAQRRRVAFGCSAGQLGIQCHSKCLMRVSTLPSERIPVALLRGREHVNLCYAHSCLAQNYTLMDTREDPSARVFCLLTRNP